MTRIKGLAFGLAPFFRLRDHKSITGGAVSYGDRDAILHSVGTNAEHGLPRTNADKRHAVMLLLNDPEWSAWSNKEIARRCCVNAATVDKYRAELYPSLPVSGSEKSPKTYITKHGTEATMRTENIGRGAVTAGPSPAPDMQHQPPKSSRQRPALSGDGLPCGRDSLTSESRRPLPHRYRRNEKGPPK